MQDISMQSTEIRGRKLKTSVTNRRDKENVLICCYWSFLFPIVALKSQLHMDYCLGMAEYINNWWASKARSILSCPSRTRTSTRSSRCSASTKLPPLTEVLAGCWCSLRKPSSKKCSIYRSLKNRTLQRRPSIDKSPSSFQKQPGRVLVLPLTTYRGEAWRSTRKRWIDVFGLSLKIYSKLISECSAAFCNRFFQFLSPCF